jgi:TrkA domain protein
VVAGTPEKVAKAFNFYRTGEMPHKTPADAPSGS